MLELMGDGVPNLLFLLGLRAGGEPVSVQIPRENAEEFCGRSQRSSVADFL